MKPNYLLLVPFLLVLFSCSQRSPAQPKNRPPVLRPKENSTVLPVGASAAEILSRKQVPVLCYHHIREPKPGQSLTLKSYAVSPESFASQMKALKEGGYQTILPDELYAYLVYGKKLPAKPVMITFDDTDEEQFTIGSKEMKKYGFKGVFFVMTVSINKPHYMTTAQLKELSDEGNAVESHTWDHHMVTKYSGTDWNTQFIKPRRTIENITGKPADYFAYPYGLWNEAAFPELRKAGFRMAFSLSTRRDSTQPLYTVRRMIVPGTWSTKGVINAMNRTFHLD